MYFSLFFLLTSDFFATPQNRTRHLLQKQNEGQFLVKKVPQPSTHRRTQYPRIQTHMHTHKKGIGTQGSSTFQQLETKPRFNLPILNKHKPRTLLTWNVESRGVWGGQTTYLKKISAHIFCSHFSIQVLWICSTIFLRNGK